MKDWQKNEQKCRQLSKYSHQKVPKLEIPIFEEIGEMKENHYNLNRILIEYLVQYLWIWIKLIIIQK